MGLIEMTSTKLQLIARKMKLPPLGEKAPAPDTSGLGFAIEQLIEKAVQERVNEALEDQRVKQSPHVRRLEEAFNKPTYTDYRQIPPTPHVQAPKAMEMHFQRDELGRVNVVNAGNLQFRVQRNELGQIVRIVPVDTTPVPPTIEPPVLAAARKYNEGEPR